MKKVSLILTTYNSRENVEKTLRSIEQQDYENIEIVIKDGGSKDGTLEYIRNYQKICRFEIILESKPDTGIYDAMNQGYELSSGDIIVFFNDVFIDTSAVSKMVGIIESKSSDGGKEYVGAHADLVYVEGDKVIREWRMGEGSIYHGWMPGHPTLFLKREIYEKYGLYNTCFKISSDYEFMIRVLKDKSNQLAYLPETIVSMFYGGTSSGGIANYLLSLKEGHQALKMNGIRWPFYVDWRRTLKVLKQFLH